MTHQEKLNAMFLSGELKALSENDENAKTIARLELLEKELVEMLTTIRALIEKQKPIDAA